MVSQDRKTEANVKTARADNGNKEAMAQAVVTGIKRRQPNQRTFGEKHQQEGDLFVWKRRP